MPDSALPERQLSVMLAVTAGFADAFAFLTLHGLLVAHVTGNLAFMAVGIARGNPHVLLKFCALPIFVTGVMAATLMIRWSGRTLARALVLEGLFFLAAGATQHWLPDSQFADDPSAFCVATLLLMAMATQNALMRIFLAKLPSTTAMTTNISEATVRWTQWLTAASEQKTVTARQDLVRGAERISLTVGSFAVGAIAGGLGAITFGFLALALPTLLLFYLAWAAARRSETA
ncbi:YoaK family protein [Acidisoma sp. 7E03]